METVRCVFLNGKTEKEIKWPTSTHSCFMQSVFVYMPGHHLAELTKSFTGSEQDWQTLNVSPWRQQKRNITAGWEFRGIDQDNIALFILHSEFNAVASSQKEVSQMCPSYLIMHAVFPHNALGLCSSVSEYGITYDLIRLKLYLFSAGTRKHSLVLAPVSK